MRAKEGRKSIDILESIVPLIIKRIRKLLDEEAKILKAIKRQVKDLISKIEFLWSYLKSANEDRSAKRLTDTINDSIYEGAIRIEANFSSLKRFLVDMAYGTEDAIDNIISNYKAKSQGKRSGGLVITRYLRRRRTRIWYQESQKIRDIRKKLIEEIKANNLQYVPKEPEPAAAAAATAEDKPLPCLHRHKLVGSLEKDCDTLVKELTRKDQLLKILYIIGQQGSGKTTLATQLYHHPTIKRHFEYVVWASVSQHREVKDILLEILTLTHQHHQRMQEIPWKGSIVELGQEVGHILQQRPSLIILDDVMNLDDLAALVFPLIKSSIDRSKIVITSCSSPINPYKYECEYVVGPDAVHHSDLAEKLITTKKPLGTSIFHVSAANTSSVSKLFKDPQLEQHFGSRRWISIGNDSDATSHILRSILTTITKDEGVKGEQGPSNEISTAIEESLSDEKVQKRLEELLAKDNHLIVLDRVQKAASDLVEHLYPILENADHRSKVIFITDNYFPYELHHNEVMVSAEELRSTDLMVKRLKEGGPQPFLFSIIDFDGSGHRTAESLYNDSAVKNHFEEKIWIPISKESDATSAWRHIISKTRSYSSQKMLDKLGNKKLADLLLDILKQKKFLLVLADEGDAKDLVLDLLDALRSSITPQKGAVNKSKIIIIIDNPAYFRQLDVTCFLHRIHPLNQDETWDLLRDIVVNHAANSSSMQQLVDQIDKKSAGETLSKGEMLKTCDGIALVVIALAGLLSTKDTIQQWKSINNTALRTNDILLLSYQDLPSHVAPCFLYLSLFPKHFEIPTGILIRLWISEGLITNSKHTLEHVAEECLEELARRCLIQVVRRNHNGKMKKICLHDEIHQLSVERSAELGFLERYPFKQRRDVLEGTDLLKKERLLRERLLRRATIHPEQFDKYPEESSNLRSFILFGKHGVAVKSFSCKLDSFNLSLDPIHKRFRLLRILLLCGITTCKTLPEQIGELVFLTYLGLRATNIQALPETIRRLQKLVTLEYRGTIGSVACDPLPNVVSQMTALRHVYLPEFAMSPMKKLDLNNLHNLQTLWGVSGGDWIKEDLEKLNPSLVKLGIVNISCMNELEAVVHWLSSKDQGLLRIFKLGWHKAEHGRMAFPKHLLNLPKLHKLILIGRLEEDVLSGLNSLVKLELFFSHLETFDPIAKLGSLPNLKALHLRSSYNGKEWTFGSEMFQKLEELQISHLPNLEKWLVEAGAMPHLKKLTILDCHKLEGLPDGLRDIKLLEELEILCMPTSFISRLRRENEDENARGGEDLNIIKNIPYVKIEACL